MKTFRMTDDRRRYAREYAQRRRAAKLDALNAGSATCQAKLGRSGRCGGTIDSFTDGNGHSAFRCPRCINKARGICRDCGRPVAGTVGKALRCSFHTEAERVRATRAYQKRNAAELRKRARDYYQLDNDRRVRKNARKRLWRKANPDKVKQYKRREGLSQNPKRLAYHAKRRERERATLATRERNRYHGRVELRTCLNPQCVVVVTGRKKKCTRCRERERLDAVTRLEALRAA